MQKNQFYYTIAEVEGVKTEGSFNLDMVIRTAEYEPKKFAILLDDFHEEFVPNEQKNKQGVVTGIVRQKQEVNSVIYLNEEDSLRFRKTMEFAEPSFKDNVKQSTTSAIATATEIV